LSPIATRNFEAPSERATAPRLLTWIGAGFASAVNAYAHLYQYEHRGSFAGWLTRIAVREALVRHRRRGEAAAVE
jgi:hypothetical protein